MISSESWYWRTLLQIHNWKQKYVKPWNYDRKKVNKVYVYVVQRNMQHGGERTSPGSHRCYKNSFFVLFIINTPFSSCWSYLHSYRANSSCDRRTVAMYSFETRKIYPIRVEPVCVTVCQSNFVTTLCFIPLRYIINLLIALKTLWKFTMGRSP